MEDQALHHFMQDLTPIIVLTTMVIAGAWILSLIIGAFKQRAHLRAQTEFHNKMMEKFSSVEQFTAYLQSDAGRSFFDNLSNEPSTPLNKILGSIQKGTILTLVGFGIILIGNIFNFADASGTLFVLGTILLMIGLGFLISSFVSYRLAKMWGLISLNEKRAGSEPSPAGV
jgi:hypothetical protein